MTKSVYKYAAEAGLPAGIYFTAMAACFLLSMTFPSLPILLPILLILFPFMLWRWMKRMVSSQPAYRKFSTVWLFGIYVIIFGTLISTLFSALYLTFINPTFIVDSVKQGIAAIESLPDAATYQATLDVMQRSIDEHLLPSGMEIVIAIAWSNCFFGSILSLILALFVSPHSSDAAKTWE